MNNIQHDIDRNWHDKFREYTEFIVNHPNYDGLYYKRNYDGNVQWVVTGKSDAGKQRLIWWNEQCRIHNIPIKKGCYATIARLLHPTKRKVCQCCGKELSILYEYPAKNLLRKINSHFNVQLEQTTYTIREIIEKYCCTTSDVEFFADEFKLDMPNDMLSHTITQQTTAIIDAIYAKHVANCMYPLSPGAMSNCPDRFDGFHSDGLCCREITDKGRNLSNMMTYTQDRRAYEEWADGDFNLANRLMGEFRKDNELHACPLCGKIKKMSADHIGPISLGFCHSIYFAPMCDTCNSSKNNRFTYKDVQKLLELERNGGTVISWHSKAIWDALKHDVLNDDDARKLSAIMLQCHHNVLKLFSIIYKETGQAYLSRFLHPEYSFFDYRFENFDAFDLSKLKIIKAPLDSANKQSNAQRHIRIAFESLEEFGTKSNRKTHFVVEQFHEDIDNLLKEIKQGNYPASDNMLSKIIEEASALIKQSMWD